MRLSGCSCRRFDLQRRRLLLNAACAAAAAALPLGRAAARSVTEPSRGREDERFMRLALEEAAEGDFPFGAVIVIDGEARARGRNLGKSTGDPTAHAEMTAIRRFLSLGNAADLRNATIYATGEPCAMCMCAIVWCGFGRVVYAASIAEMSARIGQIGVTSKAVADAAPFQTVTITGGVMSAEALALFPKR